MGPWVAGLSLAHTARLQRLPAHHSDPFDRMLVPQALTAHAEADAASFLVQQVGQSAASLADLRTDDLSMEQRIPQATLAALTANAEIALAQGQLAAYEASRRVREAYEAEERRRAARAEWAAREAAGRAAHAAREAEWDDARTARQDAARAFPSSRDWTW